MEENDLRDWESLFAHMEDPRLERTKLHRLRDIIMLAICGTLHLLWSRRMGEDRRIWESQRSLFYGSARFAQWDPVPRDVWTSLCSA